MRLFLDTSVIIEIFRGQKSSRLVRKIIQMTAGDPLNYVSVIQLAEVSDWCAKNGIPVINGIDSVKQIAQVVQLDEDICEISGALKLEKRRSGSSDFGLIDAIILASARSIGQRLLTLDSHFEGEDDCVILGKGEHSDLR